MKQSITTINTKKTLAASLRSFMEKKPLSKITVSEIIKDCGVNRKTFYYHFPDIYELLKWMLEQEAINVVKQFDLLVDYKEAIMFVIQYVQQNKHILNCAYDSMGRDELKRFFYTDFIGITRSMIDNTEAKLELHVDENFKIFLAHSYSEMIAGMLIDEFNGKESHDVQNAINFMSFFLKYSLESVLKKYTGDIDSSL